jgi:hypothetical protein
LEYFTDYGFGAPPPVASISIHTTPTVKHINRIPATPQFERDDTMLDSPTLENLGISSYTWGLINTDAHPQNKMQLLHYNGMIDSGVKESFGSEPCFDHIEKYVEAIPGFGRMISHVTVDRFNVLKSSVVTLKSLNAFVTGLYTFLHG